MSKSSPFDFFKKSTKYSADELKMHRLSICESCEFYKMKVCGKCNCFMPIKAKLEHAECPIHKW